MSFCMVEDEVVSILCRDAFVIRHTWSRASWSKSVPFAKVEHDLP